MAAKENFGMALWFLAATNELSGVTHVKFGTETPQT
jgi:hypothetical protein